MSIFNRRSREPTNEKPTEKTRFQMVTTWGNSFYSWNGKLYESDIVRSCIRPYAQAIGKLSVRHIRDDPVNGIQQGDKTNIRMLLKYPNPVMTAQQFWEKMANQLRLNNNAFALIIRDQNGYPYQLYPVPCTMVEAVYDKQGDLLLKFTYRNGKTGTFYYTDIVHLRKDFCENDLFGESPAPALAQLMECVGIIDQGIVKAVKNSGVIRWLLKFTSSMRDEDIKKNVENFVKNYMSYESESFGAAGVDAKADAKQIEPKDYVPNSAVTDRITDRIYSFFNTNKNIVQSSYNEDQWNAYYEAEVEPTAIQIGEVLTARLFTRKEIAYGNRIVLDSFNLQYASMSTKLQLVQFLDRGIMNANEIRAVLNLPPIEGGDVYVRRLDTVPTQQNEGTKLLEDKTRGGEIDGETQDQCQRADNPE